MERCTYRADVQVNERGSRLLVEEMKVYQESRVAEQGEETQEPRKVQCPPLRCLVAPIFSATIGQRTPRTPLESPAFRFSHAGWAPLFFLEQRHDSSI